MTKALPTISPDDPLQVSGALAKDKLQRHGFASAAVAALWRVSSTAGFVLSIEGPWGSGKTSTLSMMEELIGLDGGEPSVIVHFNPWLVGDRDSLLRQFLSSIASAIELTDHAGNAKNVSKELLNYAKVFDFVKWVPGAEPWATIVKGVIESAGTAVGGAADQKSLDIEGQKAKVEQALRKFSKKIFIFIDDIDRLFPSEVFEMVRIVKAIGHLPNVGYIVAWDPEYVRRALKAASVPRASTYIDKIVQVRLPLPAITATSRLQLLNEGIASLPEEALVTRFPKQDERLQALYFHGLRELLEQPRDVARVMNTLSVIEPGLRGEVVLADILGLACLIVRAPRVYEELRRNSALFVGGRAGLYVANEAEAKSAHKEKMESLYAKAQNPSATRKLVHHLFPEAAKASGEIVLHRSVGVEGHLAAPSRLNIALTMAIGVSDVSLVDAKRFILEPLKRQEIESRLTAENCLGFMEMLADVAATLSADEVVDLTELSFAISRLVDRSPLVGLDANRQFFSLPPESIAVNAIRRAVEAVDKNAANQVAFEIASDPDSLSVAAEVLSDGLSTNQAQGAIVCHPARRSTAAKKLVDNSVAALDAGSFWSRANPSRILWTIMRVAPSGAKKVFAALKRDDPTLDKFALAFLKHGFSSSGGQSYALPDPTDVKNIVNIKALVAHAKRRLRDQGVTYPLRAAWRSVVEEKSIYGSDGSDARM